MRAALLLLTCACFSGCYPAVAFKDTADDETDGTAAGGTADGAGSASGTDDGGGSEDGGSGSGGDGGSGTGDSSGGSDGSVSTCTVWTDADGDGYGAGAVMELEPCETIPDGFVANADDCDDSNDAIHPDATEVCNGTDDDCDGAIDDEDASLDTTTGSTWYLDGDGDGYGDESTTVAACTLPGGYADNTSDCDDSNSDIHPAATEVCNGLDDDCDTIADSDDACPCNLERNGGHNYLFCETVVTWTEAEVACAALDNYQLAVITDATEQAWMWAKASSHSVLHWWWLGLHNKNASDAEEPDQGFEWVDGSAVSYTEWYPFFPWEQPDDYWNDEDCVHIDPSHGYWNDLNCDIDNWHGTNIFYICESTLP